ncbi:uncharacterized protein [Panulirus ornatus]|uniref:uncharacterized protein isoform X2 n=1 Tax=Panulirus ornatus TaxID=150431 RepID=UPI003A84B1CD
MRLDQAAAVALRLLLFLGLVAKGCWGLRVSGVLVPPVVVSGSAVQLVCNYEHTHDRPDPLYSVKWYRGVNQFYEYIPKRDPPVRVYQLPHIHIDEVGSSGPMVRLTGVTRATSGTFRCEVMGDKPYFETDDHAVNMTVVDVPHWGPEMTGVVERTGVLQTMGVVQGSKVKPGDMLRARCLVGQSDPPADITWSFNSLSVSPDTPIHRSLQEDRRGRHIQVSELETMVTASSFRRGALTLGCDVRLSTIYHKTANLTLIHADHPQPAGFGWLSSGSSPQMSLLLLLGVTVLSLMVV